MCSRKSSQPQNSRIDLGFALAHFKGKLPKRMIDTGGLAKKDRIAHRLEITAAEQIDGEAKKWLKTAYDLDAWTFLRNFEARACSPVDNRPRRLFANAETWALRKAR